MYICIYIYIYKYIYIYIYIYIYDIYTHRIKWSTAIKCMWHEITAPSISRIIYKSMSIYMNQIYKCTTYCFDHELWNDEYEERQLVVWRSRCWWGAHRNWEIIFTTSANVGRSSLLWKNVVFFTRYISSIKLSYTSLMQTINIW